MPPVPKPLLTAASSLGRVALQRKAQCACGGGCPNCQQESEIPTVQTKLAISSPGDPFEQEADAVADQILSMPKPVVQRACACDAGESHCAKCENENEKLIQRTAQTTSGTATPAVDEDLFSRLGQGRPLDAETRAFFEPRFGQDFSDVRIHTGESAAESADALGALGYTVGRDVVFAQGQYAPQTSSGKRLLAHELTHVAQQRESGERQVNRQDDGGVRHIFISHGVPEFLSCETSQLDSDPDTPCCSSHTRSLMPGLYTTARDWADRAIRRMADGANMDGAITRHFGADALTHRSEILRRLRLVRAELNNEARHIVRCRIARGGRNTIGFDLAARVDARLFCQVDVLAAARVNSNVATLCLDIDGNPVSGWETLFHEMAHLCGVANLPDRADASPEQLRTREYETYQHESREAIEQEREIERRVLGQASPARDVLYPNPMPFSLRNADSYSSFVAQIGAEGWTSESNPAAYLPTLEAGPIATLSGAPRFGLGAGLLWTPFGSNIQPIIGARALWLPRRTEDVPPAVAPTDLRAYAGAELGLRWIVGGPRVQFVLDVAGGAGAYVTVDEQVDPALAARMGLGLRVGGPRAAFGVSADVMRLFHISSGALVGGSAEDWLGGLMIRGHWGGSSTRPR